MLCTIAPQAAALDRLALRWLPVLRFLVALGILVKRALKISEGDDEVRPTVDQAELEYAMLEERPEAVAERARHREFGSITVCRVRTPRKIFRSGRRGKGFNVLKPATGDPSA
jgi:hypothetical protein